MPEIDPIEIRRRQFDIRSQLRHLEWAVSLTRQMGVFFAAAGSLLILASAGGSQFSMYALAGLSTFLITPGLLYIIAAPFLRRQRYWAWMTAMVVTLFLLAMFAPLGVAVLVEFIRHPEMDTAMPGLACACLLCALASILFSLRKCRAAVLEGQRTAQAAFAVIPLAPAAAPDDSSVSAPDQTVRPSPAAAQVDSPISPSSSQSAPSPPHTPHRP